MPQRHFSSQPRAAKVAARTDAFKFTERPMSNCISQVCSATMLAFALMMSSASHGDAEGLKPATVASPQSGVIAQKSAYGVDETVARLRKDIAAKGIVFFQEIDQA